MTLVISRDSGHGAFVISNTQISSQKPRGRQLNAKVWGSENAVVKVPKVRGGESAMVIPKLYYDHWSGNETSHKRNRELTTGTVSSCSSEQGL